MSAIATNFVATASWSVCLCLRLSYSCTLPKRLGGDAQVQVWQMDRQSEQA